MNKNIIQKVFQSLASNATFRLHMIMLICVLYLSLTCEYNYNSNQVTLASNCFISYLKKLKEAYQSPADFPAGEGSEYVIEDFIDEVFDGYSSPRIFLTSQGIRNLTQIDPELNKENLIKHFLSSHITSFKYHGLTGEDKVLKPGIVRRQASILIDSEIQKIAYSSLVILEFELQSAGDEEWLISNIKKIQEDFTVANTGWLYKIYYIWIVISFVLVLIQFFSIFNQYSEVELHLSNAEFHAGPRGLFTCWIIVLFLLPWLYFFFPFAYMSHLGFYWTLSLICNIIAQNLFADNVLIHDFRFPLQRFLTWLLYCIPIIVFLSLPGKYTPVQTSVMNLSYRLPYKVKVINDKSPLINTTTKDSEVIKHLKLGDELNYIDRVSSNNQYFYKVTTLDSNIGYINVNNSQILEKERSFENESDFLDVVIKFVDKVESIDFPQEVARELANLYYKRGKNSSNKSSIKDHMEALALYNEALKYQNKNEEIHLAKAFSLLEINRRLLRDNVFNVFGVFHESAISYNKTKALSAKTILYLLENVDSDERRKERNSLINVAFIISEFDEEIVNKIQANNGKDEYSLYAKMLYEKDNKKAIEIIEDIVRLNPKNSLYPCEKGLNLLEMDRMSIARLSFDRASDLGPGNEIALLGTAVASVNDMEDNQLLQICKKAAIIENNYNSASKLNALIIKYGYTIKILLSVSIFLVIFYTAIDMLASSMIGTIVKVCLIVEFYYYICFKLYYNCLDFTPRNIALLDHLLCDYLNIF
jgi:uncharacterized membrane protein